MKRFDNTFAHIKGIFEMAREGWRASRLSGKAREAALTQEKRAFAKRAAASFFVSLFLFSAVCVAAFFCGLSFMALAMEGVAAVTALGVYRMNGGGLRRAWMVGLFPAFAFCLAAALLALIPCGLIHDAVAALAVSEGGF